MGVPFDQYCPWTEERIHLLKELWGQGYSAAECMDEINRRTNGYYSHNAIIGKANRLGLSNKGDGEPDIKTRPAVERKNHPWYGGSKKRGNTVLAEQEDLFTANINTDNFVPFMRPCGILELSEDRCKYPIGDPRSAGFYFCGAPPADGVPYCAAHASRCYTRPSDQRRNRRGV